jgi:hypothetical protein
MNATRDFHNCSSTMSILAVRGKMHTSNLGCLRDALGGTSACNSGGEGRVWHDKDPSGVEPSEGFSGMEEPDGPGLDTAPPLAVKQGRLLAWPARCHPT